MKKALSAILTLALVCAIVPWSVLQVQAEGLIVKIGDTTLPDGKWHNGTDVVDLQPTTGDYAHLSGSTLTLSDFTLNATTTTAIEITGGDCTINMVGNSAVKSADAASGSSYGIHASGGDLTFKGTGALTTESGKATSTATDASEGKSYGIRVDDGNLIFQGNGTVTAKGGDATNNSSGVLAYKGGDVTVSGKGVLEAKGGAARWSCGVYVYSGNLSVSGTGKLEATGGQAAADGGRSFGVYAYKKVEVQDNGTVTAKGGEATVNSYGVYAELEDVLVSGDGTVTAVSGNVTTGESYSVRSPKKIIVSDTSSLTCLSALRGTFAPAVSANYLYKGSYSSEWKMQGNVTVPKDFTLTIGAGETLTIPKNSTLTNNGTINNHGTIAKRGEITGKPIQHSGDGKIEMKFNNFAAAISGETITLTKEADADLGGAQTLTCIVAAFNGNTLTSCTVKEASAANPTIPLDKPTAGSILKVFVLDQNGYRFLEQLAV